jgi:hypothetical protein
MKLYIMCPSFSQPKGGPPTYYEMLTINIGNILDTPPPTFRHHQPTMKEWREQIRKAVANLGETLTAETCLVRFEDEYRAT